MKALRKQLILFIGFSFLIINQIFSQGIPADNGGGGAAPPPVGVPLDGFSDLLLISALVSGIGGLWVKWRKRKIKS